MAVGEYSTTSGSSTTAGSPYDMGTGETPQYLWQDNGSGGVNYYVISSVNGVDNKIPITREQFAAGTGEDVGAIEQWVAQQQPAATTSNDGGTTGGTGGTGGTTWDPKYFNGILYNDPQSYADAVDQVTWTNYNRNKTDIERQYNEGLLTFDQKINKMRTNRITLIKQRDVNQANIQGFFSSVSPQALQSQQGRLHGEVESEWQGKDAAIGSVFGNQTAGQLSAADLSPYANDMTQTGDAARELANLNRGKTDAMASNDQWRLSATDQTANDLLNAKLPTSSQYSDAQMAQWLAGQNTTQAAGSGSTAPVLLDEFGNPIDNRTSWWN